MSRCTGEKQDGTPCERIVSASQTFCFAHGPAQADRRSRNASKAARSKPSRELAAVKERLRGLADEVLSGQVEREAAAVAARILSVYLRALEQERKLRKQEEVLERLEALEQKARQGGQLGWR